MWLSISTVLTLSDHTGYIWSMLTWINAILQVPLMFVVLLVCGINTLPHIVGYLYFASVLGMVLDVVPEWLAEELACLSVMLAFVGIMYARRFGYNPITDKVSAVKRYLEVEYRNLMKRPDYEFPSYLILMCVVVTIYNICDVSNDGQYYRQSFYTTIGMCCSTLISYKAVTSSFVRISSHVIQQCRQISNVASRETDAYADKLASYQYYIIYLLLIDMLYLNLDPYQRGVIVSKRILFIFVFCIGHVSTILVMYSFHDVALRTSKYKMAGLLVCLALLSFFIMFVTHSFYSFMDIGILITLTNLINYSLLSSSCAFGLFIYTMLEKGYVRSLTLTMLNTRVITAALVVIIDLCTLFFAFWMVLFGSYLKIELLCLFMLFMNVVCLSFLHEGLLKLGKLSHNKKCIDSFNADVDEVRKSDDEIKKFRNNTRDSYLNSDNHQN